MVRHLLIATETQTFVPASFVVPLWFLLALTLIPFWFLPCREITIALSQQPTSRYVVSVFPAVPF